MRLIPAVNGQCRASGETLWIPRSFSIENNERFAKAVDVFVERVQRRTDTKVHKMAGHYAEVSLKYEPSLAAEAYQLDISAYGITAKASTEHGMAWALTTLYHLGVEAMETMQRMLPVMNISDSPRYGHRGLMVDVVRHFMPYEEMLRVLEQMALCKLNVLHLHLADDQGWRIESKAHPALNEVTDATDNGGHFTHEQVRDMVAFAAARGIEIIPEVDMPGHATGMVAAYPDLSCRGEAVALATKGGIYRNLLCPGKDETLQWIFEALDELCVLFPSKWFHIGGDEAPKSTWQACPHCQARMKAQGLDNEEQLQGWFLNMVIEHLKAQGRQAICWNDCLLADNIAGDVPIQFWLDMAEDSYSHPVVAAGRPVILSNVGCFYFDYGHAVTPLYRIYEQAENIQGYPVAGLPNVMGLEGTVWAENIPDAARLEYQIFPRVQVLAECAWSPQRDWEGFLERLKAYYKEFEASGINAAPLEETLLRGEERMRGAVAFFRGIAGGFDLQEGGLVENPAQMQGFMTLLLRNFFEPEELPELLAAFTQ